VGVANVALGVARASSREMKAVLVEVRSRLDVADVARGVDADVCGVDDRLFRSVRDFA
jgi:hypothetical protein